MKNIDRIAQHVAKNGAKNIMIHTIPGTSNWLICQKYEKDKWILTLANPMGNVTYNLGTVTDSQHLQLWSQLIKVELENKTSQALAAKELRQRVYKFIHRHENNIYRKFIKKELSDTGDKSGKQNGRRDIEEISLK